MKRLISFDLRYAWQDGSPLEHGSPTELCFKARHGVEIVICRVPSGAILNALAVPGSPGSDDGETGGEVRERSRLCESLFVDHRHIFRDLARDKIDRGSFALPLGYVRSILIGEDELIRMIGQRAQIH